MRFLGKLRKKKYVVPENVNDETSELYRAVWERKRLPSPGAQNYAYETLALAPQTPIGPSVSVRAPITAQICTAQVYMPTKQGLLQGTPIVSGGIRGAPLYDPNSGYSGAWPASENNPFPRFEIAPAGEAI